jgi:transcription antitermination protein NusB
MGIGSRRIGREYALRVLYAHEMTKNSIDGIFDDALMGKFDSEKTRIFSSKLVHLYLENIQEFDEIIRLKAMNWEFHRIAILDRIILRIGVCELKFFEDVPPKVSINEAIEISKKYSTEKSGKFINGILDAVLQDLKDSGQFIKTGRGLVEE